MRILPLLLLAACTAGTDKPVDTDPGDTDPVDTDPDTTDDTAPEVDPNAPSAAEIAFTPVAPAGGVDFAVTIVTESVDPDKGDVVSYLYSWSEDGAERTELTGPAVPGTETTDGEVWSVTVTPTDGTNEGPSTTAALTIGNPSSPTAPGLRFEPAEPVDGDTITLVFDPEASDADGDTLTTTITWYEDESLNAIYADSTTIDGRYVGGGETFRAVVSVTDGYHEPVTVEASVTVENNPPELVTPRISPSSPADDDDLVATAVAEDPDGSEVTFTYTWFRDGIEATDIGDTDTVPAASTTVGEVWYVTVDASDGADTVTDSSDSVTVIPWEGSMYTRRFTGVVSPDGATLSGSYALDVLTYGGRYGENDCDVYWEMDGATDPRACPRCDYSFDLAYTYDASSSTITSGTTCTDFASDANGSFSFITDYEYFSSRLYTSGYYSYDYMSFVGTGGSGYSYYGYGYVGYHSVSTSTDTAGYTTVTAYQYSFRYY